MSTQGTIKRYTLIIQKVSGAFEPNFKEIQSFIEEQGFSISPRTLQRDIEQIRNEFGIDIIYNRSKNTYSLSKNSATETSDTLIRFLEILGTAEMLSEGIKSGKDILDFISFENQGNLKGIGYLGLLIAAIQNKRKVELTHYNYETNQKKQYKLNPYLLKEYQGRWYIIGQINNSEEFRTFGLDRLEDVKVKTETYKALKNFDAKTLFNNVVGLVYTETDTEEIVFTATPLQAKYLIALPLHHSQKLLKETNIESTFSLMLKPNFELRQKFLKLGEQVKVTKPKWFANEIKDVLKKALGNYK